MDKTSAMIFKGEEAKSEARMADLLTTSTILEYSSLGLFKAFLLVDTL